MQQEEKWQIQEVKYDKALLVKCANNLMFEMSDEQYEVLLKEFDVSITQSSRRCSFCYLGN